MTEQKLNTSASKLASIPVIRDLMKDHNLLFGYRGVLSAEITKTFLSIGDNHETSDEEPERTEIFQVLVNCMEHICNGNEYDDRTAVFFIGRKDNVLCLCSGSTVNSDQYLELRNALLQIKDEQIDATPDVSNMNQMYADLIMLAVGNKVEYGFEQIEPGVIYFSLKISINKA